MPALHRSYAHPSVDLPDVGGASPLSEDEIAALSYAAWRQHLDEIAALVAADSAAERAKLDAALAEHDAREGKALTTVLNRLGFAVSDLPRNLFRAPDGVLFSLSAYRENEGPVNAISAQPIEKQEADHFYLRICYAIDISTDDEGDTIYESRVLGDNRRMTGEQIRNLQARIPAVIDAIKADANRRAAEWADRHQRPTLAAKEVNPAPQFRTEFCTLDQGWEHGDLTYLESHDTDLADMIDDGWTIANIGVTSQGMGVLRVVTLTRRVPAEAVES